MSTLSTSLDHEYAQHLIDLIAAVRDGKAIQYRGIGDTTWINRSFSKRFGFDFTNYEYRIKPEPPKPREWWIFPENDQSVNLNGRRLLLYPCEQLKNGIPYAGQVHVREVLPEREQ